MASRKRRKKIAKRTPQLRVSAHMKARGTTIFLIILVSVLGVSVAKELVRRVEVQYEVDQLEKEVARLESRNSSLQDVVQLLNTSTAREKQARTRLGVQARGETAVVLENRKGEKAIELPDSDKIRYIPVNTTKTNPQKWLDYFKEKSNTHI